MHNTYINEKIKTEEWCTSTIEGNELFYLHFHCRSE